MSDDRVAHTFLLQAIQHWGQTEQQREKATRDFVEAAGVKFPSHEAVKFLDGVTRNLKRGEFNSEVRQLQEMLATATRSPQETASE